MASEQRSEYTFLVVAYTEQGSEYTFLIVACREQGDMSDIFLIIAYLLLGITAFLPTWRVFEDCLEWLKD